MEVDRPRRGQAAGADNRSNALAGRSAAREAASSGPASAPVRARRSGWNSARPLRPVVALSARGPGAPGRCVPRRRRAAHGRPRRDNRRPRRSGRSRHASRATSRAHPSRRARLPRTAMPERLRRQAPTISSAASRSRPPRKGSDATCAPIAPRARPRRNAPPHARDGERSKVRASSSSEATGRTASAEPTSTASAATASDSTPFSRNAADRQSAGALGQPLAARRRSGGYGGRRLAPCPPAPRKSGSAPPCW